MFKRILVAFKKIKLWKKIAIISIAIFLLWYAFALPRTLFEAPYSTQVTDRNGELLGARIATDGQWRFAPTDSVAEKYKICLIEFEDRWFNYHPGVNPVSIVRALSQNMKSKRVISGGSTITMQAIRLMRQNERTYFEKLIEVILATRLELSYSKNEILAMYASHAPMGGNVVGIDAAAWRYFGHDASNLSWAEAATLAVLPNSPSLMHFGRNRDGLTTKRNKLLKHLFEKQIIDKLDYELSIVEPLPVNPYPLPQIAPHLVTQLYQRSPGSNIRSTIDKHLQLQSEDILERWNKDFAQNGVNNISALIVDLKANEIISYNGNVNFNSNVNGGQVDIIQSTRSTGSVLKPFLYSAMLQEGLLLPREIVPDVPININGFAPKNFSLNYDGAVHVDEALARSLNIPFVVLLRRYGIEKLYEHLKDIGFTTINQPSGYYGLSLILGGVEAKLIEVAQAYADMANIVSDNGMQQYSFKMIKDEVQIKKNNQPELDAAAAWLTLEALTNVNRPEELDWNMVPSMRKVAWKTGTSNGFRDAWSVGVTPDYLVAVWTGNANGEGRAGLTGARTSAHVMFDLFNILPNTGWFDVPYQSLSEVKVCRNSGLLAGMHCPESSVDTVLVPIKGSRANVCDYHKLIHTSLDDLYQVYEECSESRGIHSKAWFVLPPTWEWYYKQHNPEYKSLPPFSPECSNATSNNVMQFIYPYPNSVIKMTKQIDGKYGAIVFEVAHRDSSSKLFWHLDADYIGETTNIHQISIAPTVGEHVLTVVDDSGNSISTKFIIDKSS